MNTEQAFFAASTLTFFFHVFICVPYGLYVATEKNRSGMEGAMAGLLLGPIGVLVVACLPTMKRTYWQSKDKAQRDRELITCLGSVFVPASASAHPVRAPIASPAPRPARNGADAVRSTPAAPRAIRTGVRP